MREGLRLRLGIGGLLTVVVAVAFLGGAGTVAASKSIGESDGRALRVTISDDDDMRLSSAGAPRYIRYSINVENFGNATLTNGRMTLTLMDTVNGAELASAAVYQTGPSTSLCSAVDASTRNVLTCSVPNLGGGADVTYALYFQAPSDAGTTATTLTVNASVNERGSDGPPNDPQVDSVNVSNATTYVTGGGAVDLDTSWIFPGGGLTLATGSADEQSTTFRVPGSAAFLASLKESPASVAGSFCPGCFGEIVSTDVADGVFSSSTPIEITTVMSLTVVPKGINEKSLVVTHRYDNGSTTSFATSCASGTLPCRTVTIDRKAGTMTIVAKDSGNGQWGFG